MSVIFDSDSILVHPFVLLRDDLDQSAAAQGDWIWTAVCVRDLSPAVLPQQVLRSNRRGKRCTVNKAVFFPRQWLRGKLINDLYSLCES